MATGVSVAVRASCRSSGLAGRHQVPGAMAHSRQADEPPRTRSASRADASQSAEASLTTLGWSEDWESESEPSDSCKDASFLCWPVSMAGPLKKRFASILPDGPGEPGDVLAGPLMKRSADFLFGFAGPDGAMVGRASTVGLRLARNCWMNFVTSFLSHCSKLTARKGIFEGSVTEFGRTRAESTPGRQGQHPRRREPYTGRSQPTRLEGGGLTVWAESEGRGVWQRRKGGAWPVGGGLAGPAMFSPRPNAKRHDDDLVPLSPHLVEAPEPGWRAGGVRWGCLTNYLALSAGRRNNGQRNLAKPAELQARRRHCDMSLPPA